MDSFKKQSENFPQGEPAKDVFTKEYLQTCIRGTFRHIENKCKFVEDPDGYFFLNPLSGEMVHITDRSFI